MSILFFSSSSSYKSGLPSSTSSNGGVRNNAHLTLELTSH